MTNQIQEHVRQKTRVSVYGVVKNGNKTLLITQGKGPFTGKFDFPGGGIEFGETPGQALRREFFEEIAVEFDSFKLLDNLTAATHISSSDPYIFYQIGLIYQITDYRFLHGQKPEFEPVWMDLNTLSENQCSPLLWKYIND